MKYCQEGFSPNIAEYQTPMVKFEGPELQQVEPKLKEAETCVIAVSRDESAMNAHEYCLSVW